jgi:hypothetical protein
MKSLITAALFVILFSAQAAADEVVYLMDYTDQNGNRITYETTKETLERCPVWKMEEEVPFPIHKAVEVTTRWAKEKYPNFTDFDIVNISLCQMWEEKHKGTWYYNISINANVDLNGINANSYFSVLVLMDGTIVEPRSSKEGK